VKVHIDREIFVCRRTKDTKKHHKSTRTTYCHSRVEAPHQNGGRVAGGSRGARRRIECHGGSDAAVLFGWVIIVVC
jgi:hypothetical protein